MKSNIAVVLYDFSAQFFGKLSSPTIYVGGKKDKTGTFSGNIYKIGFCSSKSLQSVSSIFDFDGLPYTADFVESVTPFTEIADAGLYSTEIFEFLYDGGVLGE